MQKITEDENNGESRTPQGVRGLKSKTSRAHTDTAGRTPQGVRGLKYLGAAVGCHLGASHPARGAWIEISMSWWLS